MDAFGDNFTNDVEIDPAAEFLAREQDQLAGLEDEIPPVAMTAAAPTTVSINDGNNTKLFLIFYILKLMFLISVINS